MRTLAASANDPAPAGMVRAALGCSTVGSVAPGPGTPSTGQAMGRLAAVADLEGATP